MYQFGNLKIDGFVASSDFRWKIVSRSALKEYLNWHDYQRQDELDSASHNSKKMYEMYDETLIKFRVMK